MISSRNATAPDDIRRASRNVTDPAGRTVAVLDDTAALELAKSSGCLLGDIYVAALQETIWPFRYIRNRAILSCREQLKLAFSRVAVVGAGGLGGTLILLLARTGVGGLRVIDGDVFDETNLNRQALSRTDNLETAKAAEAAAMVRAINPAVEIAGRRVKIDARNASELLKDVDVVVDALDNVSDRIVLNDAAEKLGIALVHGAIAGFEGQLMTVYPGDAGLKRLYGDSPPAEADPARPEAVLGVPAITPSLVATLQAMEVIKILLNRGQPLRNRMLHIDLENGRFEFFKFSK